VFEAEREESDVMRRPPRSPNGALLPRRLVLWFGVQGAVALAAIGGVLLWSVNDGLPEDQLRATVFFALVAVILSLVLVNRSFSASIASAFLRPNRAFAAVVAVILLVFGLSQFAPPATALLRLAPIGVAQGGAIALAGALVLVVLEALKRRWRVRWAA
jgi:Ca2+-transporting ATPase